MRLSSYIQLLLDSVGMGRVLYQLISLLLIRPTLLRSQACQNWITEKGISGLVFPLVQFFLSPSRCCCLLLAVELLYFQPK